MKRTLKKPVSILLSLVIVVSLFIIVPITADASSVTGFFDCTSGSAEGYFFYRNHFCKIEWTGINTQSTSEVQLFELKDVLVERIGSNGESTSVVQDIFAVKRRGGTIAPTLMLWDATLRAYWNPLEVENLTAGQSSAGYTNSKVLAAGADNNNYKKVCTITCAAANAPAWEWSDDFTACTATFTCDDEPSLTQTVYASVSTEGYTATASVTFNNTVYTETITIPGFSVNKAGDTYTIRSEEGWNTFCDCLQDNDAYNRFSGKTVLLADDITVTRIAGGAGHDFKGIFDGQGHTLTVAYGTADSPVSDDDKAAPFRNVESGCVIKNLHTQGTIYTSRKYAGGIVGTQYGTVKLENCRSSVTINSMTAGDGSHGGLVGHNGSSNSAKLTIDGCVFDGKILSVGDDLTTNCAGFVGYKDNNVTITNSIYAPKALEADETEVTTGTSATFVRNGSPGTNCYYTRTLGTAQGKQARTVTAGENVTLAPSGTAKTYTVSGITAYENNNGLLYGDTIYAGNGDIVSLTLGNTTPTGYAFTGYTVTAGTLQGTENPYTLTMPDSDVTVTAEFTYADGVGASVIGHSVSLDGDIGVNFYMELDPEIAQSETAYMHFTIPDTSPEYQEQTVSIKDVEPIEGSYYVFKCRVAAKDMKSVITAQILGVDKETTVYTYSVKDYADWLIEHKNDSAAYTKAAPLVEKMLRYGAYAKEYFDNTNTLPDLGDVNIDSKFDTYTSTVSDDLFDGATLSLKSQTTLSLYFTDTDKLTFTCVDENGAERTVETVRNGSTQIARIRNIAASELQNSFTVTVKKGETVLGAITYSPMNYCYKALNGSTENENLINAVKALAAYSDAANEFFKAGA